MKKAFLLGITLLATFSLTGCEILEGILSNGQDMLDEKKDYKYDDFAVLVAGTEFSYDYTKCSCERDVDGEKKTYEYTYNAEKKQWYSGEDKVNIDVASYLPGLKTSAEFIGKSVDSIYKFSASKKGYFITLTYKDKEQQLDGEYVFDTNGLFKTSNEKKTNLSTVKASTIKNTYTYSKQNRLR